jgi:hypothetical protein
VETCGTRTNRYRVRDVLILSNSPLKFGDLGSGTKPGGAETLYDLLDFRLFDKRLAEDKIVTSQWPCILWLDEKIVLKRPT